MTDCDVHGTLDRLFRRQAGQLTATLARILGPARLDLAETVVQDALVSAMQSWPRQGIPENPAGWLMRVARNRAMDVLRHEAMQAGKAAEITKEIEEAGDPPEDDPLKLLFICCHPEVPADAPVPIALKTLFGFSTAEVARAFLAKEETIQQRIVRAKRRIAEAGLKCELPEPAALPARLPSVLDTLYLVFSEGYSTHGGDELVRKDICREAIRITSILVAHPLGDKPEAHALLALMGLNASRLDARVDDAGDLLLLKEQDRTLWDRHLLGLGLRHLDRASNGGVLTRFHYEAGIAACHALAPSYDATDWRQMVFYYDGLMALVPSPVVALNRAAALAMRDGDEAGLKALAPLKKDQRLERYHLLFGVEAELLARLGRVDEARRAYGRALELVENGAERRFLEKRLTQLP